MATHLVGGTGMAKTDDGGFHAKLPATKLGRISMWMAIAFIIAFGINGAIVGVVGTSTDAAVNEFSRTYMPYWGMVLMGTGFAAGVVGLVAILKDKERSLVTLLTLVPTLFVVMFLLGEFLVPH